MQFVRINCVDDKSGFKRTNLSYSILQLYKHKGEDRIRRNKLIHNVQAIRSAQNLLRCYTSNSFKLSNGQRLTVMITISPLSRLQLTWFRVLVYIPLGRKNLEFHLASSISSSNILEFDCLHSQTKL